MDLYLKYLSDFEKNYHVIHKPFFVLFLSFILVLILLNKKEKILLITLIISAFSNIFDIIFNNLTIINYINFYFFYNNLSDILVSVVLLLEIVYYFSDKNEKE
jgi:lipoprotein signal peptidase